MSSELQTRMRDLADEAPTDLPRADLWAAGVRRRRRRRVEVAFAIAVVVACVGAAGALVRPPDAAPQPTAVPANELHLPRTVYAPSPWAAGTDELGPPGPLAVVTGGERRIRDGLTGYRSYLSYYGVSAVDGSVRFLDLDLSAGEDPGTVGFAGQVVLSPDGTKVGYVRWLPGEAAGDQVVVGWAVYDTVTGKTVVLKDPAAPRPQGDAAFEITFTGDSRYLTTNYSRTRPATNRTDELVAWDVTTGERHVVEPPGEYWLPNMGRGPNGVVWSRHGRTHVVNPVTGSGAFDDVPREVVQATYAPLGYAFAYIGHRKVGKDQPAAWHLYGGVTPGLASGRLLEMDFEPRLFLGWRDAEHVVVSNHQQQAVVVDVRTGATADVDLTVPRESFPSTIYAADLWGNDLVDGVRPDRVPDPRWDVALGVAGVLGALLLAGLAVRGRRRRVRP
jgi:hypothetical protein